eukprot:jgi/Picre1/28020/NNA_000981.t1
MYNQKSINESFVQENRAETVIDTICHMESSNAIKTGCIPHISRICHMAIDFRTRFETDSFESMSGSAVGYLSEALISQQWPHDGKKTLHKQQVMTLLSCLSHAPKLPQKDWSACLRRYVKMFPEDIDVQVSIVKFVCSHATGSIADKIRDFVCVDALNLGGNVLQPKTLMLEALCYIFCHLSDIIPLLSDDQVLLYLNSLDNAFSIDTRRSKLIAFSLAFGLQTFVTEIDNISQTALAYELMIQVLLPRVDMSSRFHAPLCALYSQSDEELTAVALRREDWVFEDNILVETPEINIERNASIAACLLRAIRSADTATQVSITRTKHYSNAPHAPQLDILRSDTILGNTKLQQSLYHIMACVSSTDNSVAHQMISNMAHGIHILVRNSQPSKSKDVLTWLADIFGDEKKYMEKTETIRNHPCCLSLAVMCIAACYAGEVGHSAAYDLSLDESIMLLPKALSHFMKHQPSHQSVYRHLIRCLDDIDRPNMDLIRVSLSTLYVDHWEKGQGGAPSGFSEAILGRFIPRSSDTAVNRIEKREKLERLLKVKRIELSKLLQEPQKSEEVVAETPTTQGGGESVIRKELRGEDCDVRGATPHEVEMEGPSSSLGNRKSSLGGEKDKVLCPPSVAKHLSGDVTPKSILGTHRRNAESLSRAVTIRNANGEVRNPVFETPRRGTPMSVQEMAHASPGVFIPSMKELEVTGTELAEDMAGNLVAGIFSISEPNPDVPRHLVTGISEDILEQNIEDLEKQSVQIHSKQ